MIDKKILCCFFLMMLVLIACKRAIKRNEVIGKWKYIKVSNPYSRNPDDTVSARELNEKSPSVTFSSNDDMVIMSEGKILSLVNTSFRIIIYKLPNSWQMVRSETFRFTSLV